MCALSMTSETKYIHFHVLAGMSTSAVEVFHFQNMREVVFLFVLFFSIEKRQHQQLCVRNAHSFVREITWWFITHDITDHALCSHLFGLT